jgi:hypothetical protein
MEMLKANLRDAITLARSAENQRNDAKDGMPRPPA